MTTLKYSDFSINESDVSDAGHAYLLQYGFAKSLQDSVAGLRKELESEMDESGTRKHSDVEVAVMLHDAMQARFDAIVAGTVGTGNRGPRVAGIDKVMRDIAIEALRAGAAKAGRSLPKKAADLNALADKYIAKYADKVRAAAEARMAETADLADFDL